MVNITLTDRAAKRYAALISGPPYMGIVNDLPAQDEALRRVVVIETLEETLAAARDTLEATDGPIISSLERMEAELYQAIPEVAYPALLIGAISTQAFKSYFDWDITYNDAEQWTRDRAE